MQTQTDDNNQPSTSAGPTSSNPTASSSGMCASSLAVAVAKRQPGVAAEGGLKRLKGVPWGMRRDADKIEQEADEQEADAKKARLQGLGWGL